MIQLKRVYEAPSEQDGQRILVERLWPRGLTKEKAAIDLWLKDLGPSTELRKWYGHVPEKWDEFRSRYWSELIGKADLLKSLKHRIEEGRVTLVFASKDEERNSSVALKEYLEKE